MPKKKKTVKKTKKSKDKYVCYDCGSEVTMDCCSIGFTKLICCDKVMTKSLK